MFLGFPLQLNLSSAAHRHLNLSSTRARNLPKSLLLLAAFFFSGGAKSLQDPNQRWRSLLLLGGMILLLSGRYVEGLECYVGVFGFTPSPQDCEPGTCATYTQNGALTFGCFTSAACADLQDSFCCQTDLCNSGILPLAFHHLPLSFLFLSSFFPLLGLSLNALLVLLATQ